MAEKWGECYAAIVRFWDNAWEEFSRVLDLSPDLPQCERVVGVVK